MTSDTSLPGGSSSGRVSNFADSRLRAVPWVGADWLVEYLASADAVRLIAGIICGIKPAIAVQFPLYLSSPGQHPAFDAAEICPDQHLARCCTDHSPAAVSQD